MSATLIGNALENFFRTEIEPGEFARAMRKFNGAVYQMTLNEWEVASQDIDVNSIRRGIYYTTAIAELIDPYLDDLEYFKNKK